MEVIPKLSADTPLNDQLLDPLLPPWPVAPYHDPLQDAWMISRYADVLAAFREPRLRLTNEPKNDRPDVGDTGMQSRLRSETLAALSAAKLAEWQAQIEPLAYTLIDRLPGERPVDIVGEFARPWSLATAVIVTGADTTRAERLASLARQVSLATADPADSSLQSAATEANTELKQILQNSAIPRSGAVFVALSQTLPSFLANAWLALLRHPEELARLRADPELMPQAMEELLRYAGLTRKVSRYASASVNLREIAIAEGARVILMLASANRDPEQFPDPDRLDLTRRAAGPLAFGMGPHACVGASLIRMAASIATRVFVERFLESKTIAPAEWCGGSVFRWAASLYVLLHHRS
jgi:cytochrome P450